MNSDKTYDITKTNTVIDLNENLTNFSCSFNISILNGEDKEIEVAVIDPMDENEVEYQKLKGGNSGSIEKTEGPYKSFMLALKLPERCKEESLKVHVSTNLQNLDQQHNDQQHNDQQQDNSDFVESNLDNYQNDKKKINWFKIILILIILGIGGYMIYYFYKKDNKKYSSRNFGKFNNNHRKLYSSNQNASDLRRTSPEQARLASDPFSSSPFQTNRHRQQTHPITQTKSSESHPISSQVNSSEILGKPSSTFNTESTTAAPVKKSKNIFEKMNDIEL